MSADGCNRMSREINSLVITEKKLLLQHNQTFLP